MPEFVHLHVHSEYSLLDGLARIDDLFKRAKTLGMPALALTDHGVLYGAIEFYRKATRYGIKPIIGCEVYVARRGMDQRTPRKDSRAHHLTLLARDAEGYRNLLQLTSRAQLEGFYYKPRVDKELLSQYAGGLIALSGCNSAELPRLLKAGRLDKARQVAGWYHEVFGRDSYYFELQEHDIPELTAANKELVAMSREMGIPLVATNDVHYVAPEDAYTHEVLLCIQTNTTINDPKRMRYGPTFYLRTPEEMARLFAEIPGALSNSLAIAEQCNLDLKFDEYHLPPFDVPEGFDARSYLRHLCDEGLKSRYDPITPELQSRLEYELQIIHDMAFDTYFLIVWDLCRYARHQGIWFNVRGSAASSIVAYALRITNLDPIQHELIFDRFLNKGRVTMPDIDLDFPDDQRDVLIQYTLEKYGHDHVAQIITFGTMGARAAVRDAGRALDFPASDVDRVARLIPAVSGKPATLRQALEDVTELRQLYDEKEHIRRLLDTAQGLEGVARHASTHAAGVVVADQPLVNYTPLNRPTGGSTDGAVITQYPMDILEAIGLLKLDFLGLSTLTIMRRACELIKARYGVEYDLNSIPVEDEKAFQLLASGNVTGIFQVESCLSGETCVGHRTIRKLYEEFNAPGQHRLLWQDRLKLLSCYLDDGRFHRNAIERVVKAGLRPVYRLVDEAGHWVKATADHHFLTQRGWVRLGELDPAVDRVLFKTDASRVALSARFSGKGNPMYGRPPKATKTYANAGFREDLGHYVPSSWEADLARVFRFLGLEYQYEPQTFQLSDGDRTLTYTPDFCVPSLDKWYEVKGWMDKESEKKIELFRQQYPEYELVVVDKTYFAELELQYSGLIEWECPRFPDNASFVAIRSIEYVGEEETYDIQMRDPGNNFIANGFIVHNSGMRRILTQMKPTRFEHIVATISLYRPGPMEYIDDYIDRLHGRKPVSYHHPALEPILAETYGIIVYQEQIIKVASQLSGYTPSEADLMRRAVGKKKKEELLEHRDKFVAGAVERGLPTETAHKIFDDIEFFARYGFNKSHAADYAMLTCQTAYLKAEYPVEYMTAMLSVERGNSDKVGALIAECQRMGIPVLPPDVNRSELDFTIEAGPAEPSVGLFPSQQRSVPGGERPKGREQQAAIRCGLGAVKNVGDGPVQLILEARRGKPFATLDDLCQRVDLRGVNRRALECLIKCGALDSFGTRGQLLAAMDRMMGVSQHLHQAQEVGQMSLFDIGGRGSAPTASLLHPLPPAPDVPTKEQLIWEKELLGLYISEHPLHRVAGQLDKVITTVCGKIDDSLAGQKVVIGGMVASVRIITTKKGDSMAFARLEDLYGGVEIIVFPRTFEATRDLWVADTLVVVRGRIELRDGKTQVICESATEFAEGEEEAVEQASASAGAPADSASQSVARNGLTAPAYHLHITVPRSGDESQDIKRLGEVYRLLEQYHGHDCFSLYVAKGRGMVQLDFPNASTGYCVGLERALTQVLGNDVIRVESKS